MNNEIFAGLFDALDFQSIAQPDQSGAMSSNPWGMGAGQAGHMGQMGQVQMGNMGHMGQMGQTHMGQMGHMGQTGQLGAFQSPGMGHAPGMGGGNFGSGCGQFAIANNPAPNVVIEELPATLWTKLDEAMEYFLCCSQIEHVLNPVSF